MGVAADLEVVIGDALLVEGGEFFEHHRGVDDAAVADDRHDTLIHNARRDLVQSKLMTVGYHGMTGVGAALAATYHIVLAGDEVCDLAFSLIAPLGTHKNRRGHWFSSPSNSLAPPSVTAQHHSSV